MSSRVRNLKKSIPSDDVLPVTSEDDLLGPGDGNTKIGQKSILKNTRSVDKEVGKVKDSSGSNASDASNDVMESRDRKFIILLEQMHKKDVQIEKLSEAVSCMAKEIQTLNAVIKKMQEQVGNTQANASENSKGVHNVPFSKVSPPEGKKNGLTVEKTPFSKVPRDVAKKTVKFTDVVKRGLPNATKEEEVVVEIQASSWKGKDLSYFILLESGKEKWIKSTDCISIQGMVDEFHKKNPGAPNKEDYSLSDSLKSEQKKKRTILSKIKKNQTSKLKSEDIGFIAQSLVQETGKPKEFSKVAFGIANKRVFKGFTYTQKQTTIKKIIHQYGLNQKVVRISLVGDSVLELYTIKEEKEIVIARMQSNGWNQVEFNPEELPKFCSKNDEAAQKIALINRLAFLYAGTTLQNLKKIIISDLSESVQDEVLIRAKEILEKRTAIKEGRAQAKLVQKSEL